MIWRQYDDEDHHQHNILADFASSAGVCNVICNGRLLRQLWFCPLTGGGLYDDDDDERMTMIMMMMIMVIAMGGTPYLVLNEYFFELNPRKNPVLNNFFELNPRKIPV